MGAFFMVLGERARIDCLGLSSARLRWTPVSGNGKLCSVVRDHPLFFSAFLVNSSPPKAVSVGGRVTASGDDSHGLSLGVGVRVDPHIG